MTRPNWYRFKYRDFYDIPRMIVVSVSGRTLLLDCEFDNNLEDFRDCFVVYELREHQYADVDGVKDWRTLPADGLRLGSIPIGRILFDLTKRAELCSESLDELLQHDSI